jgi:hypothetical protein
MQRHDLSGEMPFDLPKTQILPFQNSTEISKMLPQAIENQLARFRLFGE